MNQSSIGFIGGGRTLRMVDGAAETLLHSGLAPADVMNLVPVKPLAEMEPIVLELYSTRLPVLFQKIKP